MNKKLANVSVIVVISVIALVLANICVIFTGGVVLSLNDDNNSFSFFNNSNNDSSLNASTVSNTQNSHSSNIQQSQPIVNNNPQQNSTEPETPIHETPDPDHEVNPESVESVVLN